MPGKISRRDALKASAIGSGAVLLPSALSPGEAAAAAATEQTTIKVCGEPWGVSTRYIGADRGVTRFDIGDIKDLGINTYRFYEGHMYAWEWEDDDGIFGSPTIDEIKADPDVVNWEWWDNAFTHPPEGSPFWYATNPGDGWQGNWRQIFASLRDAHVKPMVSLRVQNATLDPDWATPLNPPNTPEGRNEWWEHVFACVYWLNVRNDYRVDDWELGNEPNHDGQGWLGTEDDYWDFVRLTKDAIDYTYQRYLPHREYRTYAPVSAGTSVNDAGERFGWIKDALEKVPESFDAVDYHDFSDDPSENLREVHQLMTAAGQPDRPLWVTEWGPVYGHGADAYQQVSCGVLILQNLIRMSSPDTYVYGSQIVNLYDAPNRPYLIAKDGTRRVTYYALRMGIRALQGGRVTHRVTAGTPDLLSITTRDSHGDLWLLVVNSAAETAYDVDADLSDLVRTGTGELWEFSDANHDTRTGRRRVIDGHVDLQVPAVGAVLMRIEGQKK
jgi:hypothetical protein